MNLVRSNAKKGFNAVKNNEKSFLEPTLSGDDSQKEPYHALHVVIGIVLAGWAIGGDQGWWWFPQLVEARKLNMLLVCRRGRWKSC